MNHSTYLTAGSYGEISLVFDKCRGEHVACKKVKVTESSFKEIEIMSTLSHPNLNFALWWEEQDGYYRIFQDLAVTDLERYVSSHPPLSPPHALEWLIQITDAVTYLHSLDIVHGDIKPANILLYPNKLLRLSDFSISRHLCDTQVSHCTWEYSSPEMHGATHEMRENKYCSPLGCDIWALGCTFYKIITGETLFRCTTNINLFEKHGQWLKKTKKRPSSIPPFYWKILRQTIVMPSSSRLSSRTILHLLVESANK